MMPPSTVTCVLLAAGFDWLEALLPFLFVAFWILSQVFAVFRRLQGGGQKPPRPLPKFDPARGQPGPPRQAGDAAEQRTALDRQIAEFLREVTGDPAEKARPAAGGGQRQPEKPRPEPSRQTAAAPGQPGRRDEAALRPAVARDRERPKPAATPPKTSVAASKTAVAASKTAVAQGRLTPPPAAAPKAESVARHVQDAFSHELTHLRGELARDDVKAAAPAAGATPPARVEDLVHVLRNPLTVRQMVVLREILDRPVDRW